MQQEIIRPISTYDNLHHSGAGATPKLRQASAGESPGAAEAFNDSNRQLKSCYAADNESSSLRYDSSMNGTQLTPPNTSRTTVPPTTLESNQLHPQQQTTSDVDLNETSHSIAAVRAALSDAKSKFFGINNYDGPTVQLLLPQAGPKPEPKYQNVPQRAAILPEAHDMQPMKTTTPTSAAATAAATPRAATLTPDRSLRYGATYEQIPLSDLDAPQPSQAVYMSTTVPQNMKGIKIAGRHTPTRNSLRHSRMIVVNNKSQHNIQDTYSSHERTLNLSRQLLISQLVTGLLIVGLAIWILVLAPSASILINPYLSGLSLLLASIAGIILLGRDRRSEYHRSHNNCYKVLIAESYVFSALALIFCCLALVCAAIEFAELTSPNASTDGSCGPATSSLLSYRNCTCISTDPPSPTEPTDPEKSLDDSGQEIQNCEVIRHEWKYLLGFSMALNSAGILATFLYITVFICCHRSSRKHFNTSI